MNEENLQARSIGNSPSANSSFITLWDPHNQNLCVTIISDSIVKVTQFDTSTGVHTDIITVRKWSSIVVTCAQFNPHTASSGRLAAGTSTGKIFIFNIRERTQKLLEVPERTTAVVDVQWDKLSSVYLLVAYSSFCSLWDSETMAELVKFDKTNNVPITGIQWLDWTAGNFITSNAKTGKTIPRISQAINIGATIIVV